MARINANISKATYNIRRFRGLNENESGEGALKDGEASAMRNWRVTDGGALTSRPTLVEKLMLGNAYEELAREDIGLGERIAYGVDSEFFTRADFPIPLYSGFDLVNGSVVTAGEVVYQLFEDPFEFPPHSLDEKAYFEIGGEVYRFDGMLASDTAVNTQTMFPIEKVKTLWSGYIGGRYELMAVAGKKLWRINTDDGITAEQIDGVILGDSAHIFGFNNKLYILTGDDYLSWDGDTAERVEGYIPCVLTACEPATGSGTVYERVNTLSQYRKCRYNADGTSTVYKIVEAGAYVTEVKVGGEVKTEGTDYTKSASTVTFTTAPASGTENVEITYRIGDNTEKTWTHEVESIAETLINHKFAFLDTDYGMDFASFEVYKNGSLITNTFLYETMAHRLLYFKLPVLAVGDTLTVKYRFKTPREQVLAMRYSELYNGAQDNRVFLYGDGTNKAIYSGLDENGQPSAEYFPDLNECRFGSDTSPITAIVKHHNRLLVFKDNEAFSVYTELLTLADGSVTSGFYITSINKSVGCCANAQAILVENRVRTPDGTDVYEWKATSTSGNISYDQRNADRVTQRVTETIGTFKLKDSLLYYDKERHEFYCCYGGKALVQNIDADAWYFYDNVPISCMCVHGGTLFVGKKNGALAVFDREAEPDFTAEWESGSLDFDKPYAYKLSPQIWVEIKPERDKCLTVSVDTDNDERLCAELVTTSCLCPVKPTLTAKLKPKRFIRYKLGFMTDDRMTVLGANVAVSYTVNVK